MFGGPSPEHDISILTGLQAARLLEGSGRSVVCIYWTKTGQWFRVPTDSEGKSFLEARVPGSAELALHVPGGFVEHRRVRSQELRLSVVLNCCHGGPGEDGSLTSLLRLAGMRVTGPSSEAAALAMDKLATAAMAMATGVETIPTEVLSDSPRIDPPWVIKPRFGGSSLGVNAGVSDLATASALAAQGVARAGCLVQPHLEGWVDLNVAVRMTPRVMPSAIERPLRHENGILDYHAKYLRGAEGMESTPRELPAQIPDAIRQRVESSAISIVQTLGLTGIPRVDFLWDGGERLALCEVNAIPGALGLYLWEAAGVDRAQVLADLVAEAESVAVMPPQWSASSDGAALRVANTIAAKLAL